MAKASTVAKADIASIPDAVAPPLINPSAVTLHQLRIFWAVAQAKSFTKASKILDLAQPSLSQQISKLEEEVGTQLFNRSRNEMTPTDAGQFLLRKADVILSSVEEALIGLEEFSAGTRGVVSIGALSSIARNVLPESLRLLATRYPELEMDVHESSPAEAVDLLYGRRINMALLATDSTAGDGASFLREKVSSDPYVLAVPEGLDLSDVGDVERDLAPTERTVVNSTIQFNFGNQHKKRIEDWYQHVLPHYRVIAQSRSYEVALSMVQAGLGVAVVPALTAALGAKRGFAVTLYRTTLPNREIVALLPTQYARIEPYVSVVEMVKAVGATIPLPPIEPLPPLLKAL